MNVILNDRLGASSFLGNLWTAYRFPIAGITGFRIGGGVNCQDKSYSDLTNANSIPSSVVWNGLLGYQASVWGVDVNLRNLTNQRYFVAAHGAGAVVGETRSAFVGVHADL